MNKKWTGYSLAIFLSGVVLLATGIIEWLVPQVEKVTIDFIKDNPKAFLYAVFGIVFILVSVIWKGDKHP
ncbi:MAG: hypothetical protein ABR954_01655 [Dehalococcoidales bacterium]